MSVVHTDAPYLRHQFADVPPPTTRITDRRNESCALPVILISLAACPSSDGARNPT